MRAVAILACLVSLAGCSLGYFQKRAEPAYDTAAAIPCPKVWDWSLEQKKTLAAEDKKLAANSMAHRAILEDKDLRAQISANAYCAK